MWFYMMQYSTGFINEFLQNGELFAYKIIKLFIGKLLFSTAEIFFISKTGMCPDGNIMLQTKFNCFLYNFFIAGMIPACDIYSADEGHNKCIIVHSFAHIAVKIN